MQVQLNLVVAEPQAQPPRPLEGVFASLDMLIGGAAPVVEADHPIRPHGKVGYNEDDTWEQLFRIPLDLRDHKALLVLGAA